MFDGIPDSQFVLVNSTPTRDERLAILRDSSYGLYTESTLSRLADATSACSAVEMHVLGKPTGVVVLTDCVEKAQEALQATMASASEKADAVLKDLDGLFDDLERQLDNV